ncbi:MAG TPA: hypothetical protein VFL83_14830 [Anaeromyxobacter sp.]|nr:hypothetical protein [Anaeromyxobacter sp.]
MTSKTIVIAALLAAPLAAGAQQPPGDATAAPRPDLSAPAPSAASSAAPAAPPIVTAEAAAPAPAERKHGIFPLWGDKVRAKGFELPEPYGVMVNYYFQRSDIEVTNLKLGFNGGPMRDFSGLIKVPKATTEATALAIRPNVMIFPFLSLYAVYAVGDTATNVNVQVGDSASFDTLAKSGAQVVTLGGTFQLGYKGFFGVADFNGAVSDVERLADTVGANMLSFRVGYNHRFGPPGRGVALWAGTAGQVLEVETEGSVRLSEVVPPDALAGLEARCASIPPLDPRGPLCDAFLEALQDPNSTVDYSLDKKPAGTWNMILGAQYALDRNWHFRFEATFLNGRTTYLAAAEYRFDVL